MSDAMLQRRLDRRRCLAGRADTAAPDAGVDEVTEPVQGTLWPTDNAGKQLPPSLGDIEQGKVGDCYLFAALAALLSADPKNITDMIEPGLDGAYTVTFKGLGFFFASTQLVTPDFYLEKHGRVSIGGALWPLVIEKAWAQQQGGIGKLEEGNPALLIKAITNRSAEQIDPRSLPAQRVLAWLAIARQKHQPITAIGIPRGKATDAMKVVPEKIPELHFSHAYAVIDVSIETKRVKVFNPWGLFHPNGDGWMDIESFKTFFAEVDINI